MMEMGSLCTRYDLCHHHDIMISSHASMRSCLMVSPVILIVFPQAQEDSKGGSVEGGTFLTEVDLGNSGKQNWKKAGKIVRALKFTRASSAATDAQSGVER
jgi:hypothetical protein